MSSDMILINPEIQTKFPSIYQALLANQSALENLSMERTLTENKLVEEKRKLEICKKLKLPDKALKNMQNRLAKQLENIDKMEKAYSSGYLEIPRLQPRPQTIEFKNSKWWGFRFNKNVPLRVLEALDKAKEAKIFNDYVVFQQGRTDPILAGQIGNRFFYLASWR